MVKHIHRGPNIGFLSGRTWVLLNLGWPLVQYRWNKTCNITNLPSTGCSLACALSVPSPIAYHDTAVSKSPHESSMPVTKFLIGRVSTSDKLVSLSDQVLLQVNLGTLTGKDRAIRNLESQSSWPKRPPSPMQKSPKKMVPCEYYPYFFHKHCLIWNGISEIEIFHKME